MATCSRYRCGAGSRRLYGLVGRTAGSGGDGRSVCGVRCPRAASPSRSTRPTSTTAIDNPYWPMTPGSRWVYQRDRRRGDTQKVEVTVTDRTKQIIGIDGDGGPRRRHRRRRAGRGHQRLVRPGRDGNIWYLGEDTKEYENGKVVDTEGSWEAGVDGAQAGHRLPGDPTAGLTYRQEYYAGEAEDAAEVLSVDEQVEVPLGHFARRPHDEGLHAAPTRVLEHKFYAKGVGPVEEIAISGGSDRAELLRFNAG